MGQSNSKICITDADRAILQLKLAKDNLHRYSRRTDSLISNERLELNEIAKAEKHKIKNNSRARFLLKRIHYQQHLLDQCLDQLINLENLLITIEFKLFEQKFIEGLSKGNEILKKLNKELDGAEELVEDVSRQIAYQEEIDKVLSNNFIGTTGDFQQELDRELEQLYEEINHNVELQNLPSITEVPEIQKQGEGEWKANTKGKSKASTTPLLL